MANLKKRMPVRQFSLQYESPKPQERKKSITRQFSEDLGNVNSKSDQELGIRVSLSSKNAKRNGNDPPPVTKIAWLDNKNSPRENSSSDCEAIDQGIVIKKCTEVKRNNSPRRIIKQSSLDRDSILYSRQGLAKRLADAWKERETSGKTNLNIILTHTTMAESKQDDVLVDVSNTERAGITQRPKIILPLKPDLIDNSNNDANNVKNVFQKHIRRAVKQKSLFDDGYSPTRNLDRPNTIVVPLVDSKTDTTPTQRGNTPLLRPKVMLREKSIESCEDRGNSENKQTSSRPSTAASKRELFQRRTNSAFHGSITRKDSAVPARPPLLRTASVPIKPEPSKPKFVAVKRRIKTAKAKIKYDKDSDDDQNSSNRHTVQRCFSAAGVLEVVTMVSLVSPSGSENEEEDDERENGPMKEQVKNEPETVVKAVPPSPPQTKCENYGNNNEEEKIFSLRKTVKSVSFQQSSIHAVRSFSASFPGRRCSMATNIFLNGNIYNQPTNNNAQKIQEKRAPVNVLEDEESVPKRRLLRTKSAPIDKSTENVRTSTDDNTDVDETNRDKKVDEKNTKIDSNSFDSRSKPDALLSEQNSKNLLTDLPPDKFNSPKEKQCWEMYRRMNQKGVAISYDTILRGMLTPTEYRLRRKPSVVPEDNCEITEN